MSQLPNLPLLHDEDGYIIQLEETSRGGMKLSAILKYENNANVDPLTVSFFHLDERTRHFILQQIQRRYPGRTVSI